MKKNEKKQQGFTLIEVIAVLVILAVLAAVAVPRYLNLIEDARTQALQGAVAAGLSHVSLSYGRLALQTGQEPTAAQIVSDVNTNAPQSADYTFSFSATATPGVNVVATESGVTDPLSATNEWVMP